MLGLNNKIEAMKSSCIHFKKIVHRGKNCIAIIGGNDQVINQQLKKMGAKWSSTKRLWYLLYSEGNVQLLLTQLSEFVGIETTEILTTEKFSEMKVCDLSTIQNKSNFEQSREVSISSKNGSFESNTLKNKLGKIAKVNAHVLPSMEMILKLKGYSSATIHTYSAEMKRFLELVGNNAIDELTNLDLKRYFLYCHDILKLTENTIHSRINALKFYYEQVLNRQKFYWDIPRPQKRQQHPNFFNKEEILSIIDQTKNIKHKTMLMLAYGTGMRVSEVVNLKVYNIDSKRMQIKIEKAKGKKDRMVILSAVLLVMLREYFSIYKPNRMGYLFYGQDKSEPYSTRSLQMVLQEAKKRAGVLKPGSVHALRHSFATHLLDRGTDVTMIMKLLGHNEIKTTMRYLHVTNRDVLQIISPLDNLGIGFEK